MVVSHPQRSIVAVVVADLRQRIDGNVGAIAGALIGRHLCGGSLARRVLARLGLCMDPGPGKDSQDSGGE